MSKLILLGAYGEKKNKVPGLQDVTPFPTLKFTPYKMGILIK
jgi:hypothetical protein